MLLAAWIGAGAFFAAFVAPAAFDVLPSRAFAGALVGRLLAPLYISGIVVGAIAALSEWRIGERSLRVARLAAPLAMALACADAQFLVSPRIAAARRAIGSSIEMAAIDDPRRIAFGRLHALSVAYLAVAIVAAAVALWLAYSRSPSSRPPTTV